MRLFKNLKNLVSFPGTWTCHFLVHRLGNCTYMLHQKVRMFQLAAARSNYYALEAHLLLLLMAFAFNDKLLLL